MIFKKIKRFARPKAVAKRISAEGDYSMLPPGISKVVFGAWYAGSE
jgi:hypothetical protein